MKRVGCAALAVLAVLVAAPAHAQGGPPRARGPGAARLYDVRTVETVSGEVVRVERRPGRDGAGGALLLTFKTDREELAVRLGPARYLERRGMEIRPSDQLQIRGSRVTVDGKATILAAEVRKGDRVLVLRDANGVPAWRRYGGPPRGATPPAP